MESLGQLVDATLAATRAALMAQRQGGHWSGRLSGSALSTATASFALAMMDAAGHREQIDKGLAWLCGHVNADGGWGDTPESPSNLSTTLLAWSALACAEAANVAARDAARWCEPYIASAAGSLDPAAIAAAVNAIYGGDRTFSAPILTMCTLAGRMGPGVDAWRHVAPLPFEFAAAGHGMLRLLGVPVVSYALPALIAIGQVRHHFLPPACPWARIARPLTRGLTLNKLSKIQPHSGGYLEAAPLTSFVVMSLAAMGRRDHPAAVKGVEFLAAGARPDGSWPIDTNLATWVSTLAVTAMAQSTSSPHAMSDADRRELLCWLLAQQHRAVHPYTGAAPGGWAWTDFPGGVPDSDDTAGALLAMRSLAIEPVGATRVARPPSGVWPVKESQPRAAVPQTVDYPDRHVAGGEGLVDAAAAGVGWLLGLQNRDGGIPTFCRGWGRLPFDRSSPDLTAHALAAWRAWRGDLSRSMQARIDHATVAAMGYLGRSQRADGAWVPLWFGNQFAPGGAGPVYGTARVLDALAALRPTRMRQRGVDWLLAAQNADGGWGGDAGIPSTIEETAVVSGALAPVVGDTAAIRLGAQWLIDRTRGGAYFPPSPIGLYFAKLWYHEELYPLIFTAWALGRMAACRAT